MTRFLRFIEEKYEEKLHIWVISIFLLVFILSIINRLMENYMSNLISSLGYTMGIVFIVMIHISINYGDKYLLSIGGLAGLSFGIIIWVLAITLFSVGETDYRYFGIIVIGLVFLASIFSSRRRFSDESTLLASGLAMVGFLILGLLSGVVLTIPFGFMGVGVIGLALGVIILLLYGGKKVYEQFVLEDEELYSPWGAGLTGIGIGGVIGLGIYDMIYSFFIGQPFSITFNNMDIQISLMLHLIVGALTGFFFGYFTQNIKIKIDN